MALFNPSRPVPPSLSDHGCYSARVCAQMLTSYRDAADSATDCTAPGVDDECGLDDDYFRDNDVAKPARGMYIIWSQALSGSVIWEGYSAWDDINAGCTPVQSVPLGTTTVRMYSLASVNGNYVQVLHEDVSNAA